MRLDDTADEECMIYWHIHCSLKVFKHPTIYIAIFGSVSNNALAVTTLKLQNINKEYSPEWIQICALLHC